MRRAHSVHEMKELLSRRAADQEMIRPVLERLKQRGYLDDAKYAANYAHLHASNRRQGRFRIARELRGRGVPDRHIETALDAAFAETDEAELIRVRLKRKLAGLRGPLDQRKAASLYRSLLRAGFSADLIRNALRSARADLPDATDSTPEE